MWLIAARRYYDCLEQLKDRGITIYATADQVAALPVPASVLDRPRQKSIRKTRVLLMFVRRAKAYAKRALAPARDYLEFRRLPATAREAVRAEAAGPPQYDPGAEDGHRGGPGLARRAQESSRSNDGGVARHYSLITGWGASYPETTGYIVPTLLEQAALRNDASLRERAQRMLDWLVSIQFPEGGFPGRRGRSAASPARNIQYRPNSAGSQPAPRNLGIGIAYRCKRQPTGSRVPRTPTGAGEGTGRRSPRRTTRPMKRMFRGACSRPPASAAIPAWGEAGLRQVRWALTKQRANGWMESCCLSNPLSPLTHTLGYALRGILEAWRFSQIDDFLAAGRRLGDGLATAQRPDGSLPGELKSDWSPGVSWTCLTGVVQIAHSWLIFSASLANGNIGMPHWPRTRSCGGP